MGNSIGDRIIFIMDERNLTFDFVHKKTFIAASTLNKYRKNITKPDPNWIKTFANVTGANESWIVDGSGNPFQVEKLSQSDRSEAFTSSAQLPDNQNNSAFIFLKIVELKPDCGMNGFDRDRDLMDMGSIKIPRAIVDPSLQCAEITRHHGNEMEPKIHHLDYVAYMPGRIDGTGHYVLKRGNITTVRSVYFKMDGSLILKCENERFDPEEFGKDYTQHFQILGRVCAGVHITKL